METVDHISRLTAALRNVCAELDAASRSRTTPDDSFQGTGPAPHTARYREAVREAVVALESSQSAFNNQELVAVRRALEALLLDVPR